VADGTHDAFGERGLNEHDFSAGALIAEEAGCWVRRPRLTSPLDGGPTDQERLDAWTCAASRSCPENSRCKGTGAAPACGSPGMIVQSRKVHFCRLLLVSTTTIDGCISR
jgi:hypothetical protein